MKDTEIRQETLLRDRRLIREKGFLHRIYIDFYTILKEAIRGKAPVVELGSGGGFIKKIIPGVLTSDICKGLEIDRVFSAQKLPFKAGSIGAFVMLDVFHHIPNPSQALSEMDKCLTPGGVIAMIEPWNTWWGRLVLRVVGHERFDPGAGWNYPPTGLSADANGATTWIIFARDRKKFRSAFPKLRIVSITPHTPLRYILSGGLSAPQLVPAWSYRFFKPMDMFLTRIFPDFALFATVILEKR